MQLLIKRSVDFFQTKLSYFFHPEDKTLSLFLHVPMMHPKNLLQFFQLVPFTIANSIKTNTSMMPNVKEDLIAVGEENQFQLVSQTHLKYVSNTGHHTCVRADTQPRQTWKKLA